MKRPFPAAASPRAARRAAFALAETLVALAVASAVLLPSVALVRRLLAEDRRLDGLVADSLRRRCAPVAFPSEPTP